MSGDWEIFNSGQLVSIHLDVLGQYLNIIGSILTLVLQVLVLEGRARNVLCSGG